jgi:hypothetical protein
MIPDGMIRTHMKYIRKHRIGMRIFNRVMMKYPELLERNL